MCVRAIGPVAANDVAGTSPEPTSGEPKVLAEQRWLYMIEDNGGGASGFADLTLARELRHVLSRLGYEEPTPIQLAAKTAAFALPILQRILLEGEQTGVPLLPPLLEHEPGRGRVGPPSGHRAGSW